MIEFFVPGRAATAGSKTSFVLYSCKRCNKKYTKLPERGVCTVCDGSLSTRMIYRPASKYTKGWMEIVKFYALQAANRMILLEEPILLNLIFYRERPQGHFGTGRNAGMLKDSAPDFPEPKPDLGKLERAVEDALTGIIYRDDRYICKKDGVKLYCGPDDKPGVLIRISTLRE